MGRLHRGFLALVLSSFASSSLCGLLLATAPLTLAADSGTSTNLFIRKGLDDDWFLASRSNIATRDGIRDTFFGYLDLTLGRRLTDNWSVDAGYRHARLDVSRGWRDEYRPLINLTWRDRVNAWGVSNRSRVEFRFFEGSRARDRLRYRNETRLIFPEHLSPGPLRLYVEEEFFYEFDGNGLNTNWFTAGVRFPLRERLTFKLGYRWQAQKFRDRWEHRHVLVTGLVWFL
jgi:hypothetical protein